jgi:amino-acid N-acetyltransferase
MSSANLADLPISNARKDELPEILALLDECELPREGLAAHLATTLVARDGMNIVGSSALELYQECALLRSVAVKATHRRRGLASRLTKAALELARDRQVTIAYLLTETACTFFLKLGFKPVPRSEVPPKVQSSIEFTTLCPQSATAMMIPLT